MDTITIIDYRPEHQPHFERLNRAWIEKHFWLEDLDRYVLQQPEEAIIGPGGAILMATCNGEIAGTVALKKASNEEWEFTKMAVDEAFQRRGIAEKLSYAAFDKARKLGAKKISLYSQTALAPAILLYRKLGFAEVPMDSLLYKRADIKMELALEPQQHKGTELHKGSL